MIIDDYGLQPAVPFCHQLSDPSGADVVASFFSTDIRGIIFLLPHNGLSRAGYSNLSCFLCRTPLR